jgi:hypothetical protein
MQNINPNELNTLFSQFAAERLPIRLLNEFKGLPVTNDTFISAVDGNSIILPVNKHQMVCLYLDRFTYLQSKYLPAQIKANVSFIDPTRGEARLAGFEFNPRELRNRQQVRVTPVETLTGMLQPKSARNGFPADLVNISCSGIAINLPRARFHSTYFYIGADLLLQFSLPGFRAPGARVVTSSLSDDSLARRFNRSQLRNTSTGSFHSAPPSRPKAAELQTPAISMRGVIRWVKHELNFSYVRMGLKTYPDESTQALLTNFVSTRQAEILREMKALDDMLDKFGG